MGSLVKRTAFVALLVSFALIASLAAPGGAQPPPGGDRTFNHDFETPILGINAIPNRSQIAVADTGAGIVRLTRRNSNLVTALPGVSDVLPVNGNRMYAITGEPPEDELPQGQQLQGVSPPQSVVFVWGRGRQMRTVADIAAAESTLNPDGEEVASNPFDLAFLGRRHLLVADAAANTVWLVHKRSGVVKQLATFPSQLADTQWLKDLVGCPGPGLPDDAAELCELPPQLPAQPVPTTVAVGPDGFIYVGELTGFPGEAGMSRVWRVDPRARGVDCASSDMCEVVLTGLTSVIDIGFSPDGDLVVAEIDRGTFLAMEFDMGVGGAISRCDLATGSCDDIATEVPLLTSIAIDHRGFLYGSILGLVPGAADITRFGKL